MTPDGPSFAHKSGVRIGSARVPDERLARLRDLYRPKKYVPAEVAFADPDSGMGDAPSFLADADAYVVTLQAFGDVDYEGRVPDPAGRMESISLSGIVADLEKIERRKEKAEKEKRAGQALSGMEGKWLERCREHLESGAPLRTMEWSEEEDAAARHYQFQSRKPLLAAANVAEDNLAGEGLENLRRLCEQNGTECIVLCAPLEAEIGALPDGEQAAYLADYGLEEPVRNRLIKAAYRSMNLISFFTVGEDEVRAWTIRRGTAARRAAGKIHTDIERGFIRAEVVPSADLLEAGSMQACKERGTFRLEGKDYIVQDGEVVHFRFNV